MKTCLLVKVHPLYNVYMYLIFNIIWSNIEFMFHFSVAPNSAPWLTPEMLSLFIYHEMRPLSFEEESHIISSLVSDIK